MPRIEPSVAVWQRMPGRFQHLEVVKVVGDLALAKYGGNFRGEIGIVLGSTDPFPDGHQDWAVHFNCVGEGIDVADDKLESLGRIADSKEIVTRSRAHRRRDPDGDFMRIRTALDNGEESITLGRTVVRFADLPAVVAGYVGGADEFYLTRKALVPGNDLLIKTLIEEGLHNGRIAGGSVDGIVNSSADEASRPFDEWLARGACGDIFTRGRLVGWW